MKTWRIALLTVVALTAAPWGVFAQTAKSGAKSTGAEGYVENSIAVDGAKSPKPQSLTIFSGGLIYDVSVKGNRVVVFNPETGQLVLLDKGRKIKTEISTTDLDAARAQLREWCLKQADSVLQFCGKPKFELEESDGQLAFRASEMQYLVNTIEPRDKQIAEDYRKFSDAMVGLAVIGQTSPIPPLARLAINRELAQRGVMPSSVAVEVRPKSAAVRQTLKIRSHHTIGWKLRPWDLRMAQEADNYSRDFRSVEINEFLARPTAKTASR